MPAAKSSVQKPMAACKKVYVDLLVEQADIVRMKFQAQLATGQACAFLQLGESASRLSVASKLDPP